MTTPFSFRPKFGKAIVAVPVLSLSTTAMAHGLDGTHAHGTGAWAAFSAGLAHPWTGLDHVTAMICVGAWSAFTAIQRRTHHGAPQGAIVRTHPSLWRQAAWAPVFFVLSMLAGAAMGLHGWMLPGIEPMIAVSLMAMGFLVASLARASNGSAGRFGALIVALSGLCHGQAHGQELAGFGHTTAYALAGMVLGTALLHALGVMAAATLHRASTSRSPAFISSSHSRARHT